MAVDLIRGFSGAEETWLKGTAKGSGNSVYGALFNRTLDEQHILSAVQELLGRYPVLRAHIVNDAKGRPCFQASAFFSAQDYIIDRPWPSVEEADSDGAFIFKEDHHDKLGSLALHKLVTEELNVCIVNAEGKPVPPLRVLSVLVYHNSSRQQTAILLKGHGAVLDRTSMSVIMKELLYVLVMAQAEKLHQVQGMRKEEMLPASLEELISKSKVSKGLFQKGLDAVGYAINSIKYSLLPFQPLYSSTLEKCAFQTRFLSMSLGKQGTPAFLDACKKEKVSWAAALSAALLKTVATLDEVKEKKHDEFCLTIITDCRPFLEPKLADTALGNYASAVPEGIKVQRDADLWDIARKVYATIERDLGKLKQISEFSVLLMLYSQVMKYPSLTWKGSMRTGLLNISVDQPMEGLCQKDADQLGLVGTLGPIFSNSYVGACFYILECLLDGPELIFTLVYTFPLYSYGQMHHILQSSIQLLLEAFH